MTEDDDDFPPQVAGARSPDVGWGAARVRGRPTLFTVQRCAVRVLC